MPFDFDPAFAPAIEGFAPAITPAPILPVVPLSRPDEVLNVLVKARAKIANEGDWCNSGPGDAEITFCAAVAIRVSAGFVVGGGPQPEAHILWSEAQSALEAVLCGFRDVPDFNDAPTTTHADVLALFDRAIATRMSEGK